MGVSRQTFGRIVESARRKTADALLNGKKLRIEGGTVVVKKKESDLRLVAVPTASRGQVESHFGRCERLTVYTIGTDGAIQAEEIVEAIIGPGCRSSVISQLAAIGVSALVVGCIGEGAVHVCGGHGIAVVRGASGSARIAALAYARGEIEDSGLACGGVRKTIGRGCR
jgi:predicted Fe-Mo cluster-binding NifX family protein